jgi:hypothetical protein
MQKDERKHNASISKIKEIKEAKPIAEVSMKSIQKKAVKAQR